MGGEIAAIKIVISCLV